MDKKPMGRITVNEQDEVIGSGGSPWAKEAVVENREGRKIGTTTVDEATSAWGQSRPLRYRKD